MAEQPDPEPFTEEQWALIRALDERQREVRRMREQIKELYASGDDAGADALHEQMLEFMMQNRLGEEGMNADED